MSAKPVTDLLNDYASKSVQELDLLVNKGLLGISAVGNEEDASPAVILFAGPEAGQVFLKLVQVMQTLPEYKHFIDVANGGGN